MTPRFCPNRACSEHWHTTPAPYRWFKRAGFYANHYHSRIQRFRCLRCGHSFSESTFSLTYHAKKHLDLRRLRRLLVHGASMRACARQLFVSPTTIARRIMLLARQSLALHGELAQYITLREELVADGFQSFVVSQYHPNNFNLLAGAESQYLYAMSEAILRRSGRMTTAQKRRRAEIEQRDPPDPTALERSFTTLMHEAGRIYQTGSPACHVLRTDEHQTYPRAMATAGLDFVRHSTVSSRRARTRENPLFAVNYLDREIRKDLAEHRRETVCFARNEAMSAARMWVYLVWHNVEKAYRISPRDKQSHAEMAGIPHEEVMRAKKHFFTVRAFRDRARLSEEQRRVWMGMIRTPERGYRENRRVIPEWVAA